MRRISRVYVGRMLGVVVVIPLLSLIVYPPLLILLPESLARLADLPRDLALILLVDVLTVPFAGLWLLYRAIRREAAKGGLEAGDAEGP